MGDFPGDVRTEKADGEEEGFFVVGFHLIECPVDDEVVAVGVFGAFDDGSTEELVLAAERSSGG